MRRNWLLALICCVCAAAISCSDDDDDVVAGDNDGGSSESGSTTEAAPTVVAEASAGSDSFTITLSVSSDAYQYGYAASTSALSLTAGQILAGTASGTVSSGVYNASSDGYTQYITVDAEESTTYYIYAAAVTQNGTYSDVVPSTVTTLASSSGTTTSMTLEYAQARYMGNNYNTSDSGALEYYVIMSDADMSSGYVQTGATYYYLDFWSATRPDVGDITLPSGTYTADGTKSDFTINTGNSMYCLRGNRVWDAYTYITGGSLTASTSDGITTITGTVTDEEGNSHEITYSGPLAFEDYSTDLCSTLTEDITPDLTGAECQAACYGDAYGFGSAYWFFEIYIIPGYVIYVDFFADLDLGALDLPAGTYTGSSDGETGTYIIGAGTIRDSDYNHSWFFTADENEEIQEPYTPIGEGTITIAKNEDGTYTITFDVYDDGGDYTIKTSWTGDAAVYDFSDYYSSSSQSLAAPMSSLAPLAPGAIWMHKSK